MIFGSPPIFFKLQVPGLPILPYDLFFWMLNRDPPTRECEKVT